MKCMRIYSFCLKNSYKMFTSLPLPKSKRKKKKEEKYHHALESIYEALLGYSPSLLFSNQCTIIYTNSLFPDFYCFFSNCICIL